MNLYFVLHVFQLGREQKSLSQLGCMDKQTWVVKSTSGAGAVSSGAQLTEVCFEILRLRPRFNSLFHTLYLPVNSVERKLG
jgi:hypothetical protein